MKIPSLLTFQHKGSPGKAAEGKRKPRTLQGHIPPHQRPAANKTGTFLQGPLGDLRQQTLGNLLNLNLSVVQIPRAGHCVTPCDTACASHPSLVPLGAPGQAQETGHPQDPLPGPLPQAPTPEA